MHNFLVYFFNISESFVLNFAQLFDFLGNINKLVQLIAQIKLEKLPETIKLKKT